MTSRLRWSACLICVALAALFLSSIQMLSFYQPRQRLEGGLFIYENVVHEAGIARITLAVLGLLLLAIPFRRGERWGWLALTILFSIYFVPVFVLPSRHVLQWRNPDWGIFFGPGMARMEFVDLLVSAAMFLGLAICFPGFFLSHERRN